MNAAFRTQPLSARTARNNEENVFRDKFVKPRSGEPNRYLRRRTNHPKNRTSRPRTEEAAGQYRGPLFPRSWRQRLGRHCVCHDGKNLIGEEEGSKSTCPTSSFRPGGSGGCWSSRSPDPIISTWKCRLICNHTGRRN